MKSSLGMRASALALAALLCSAGAAGAGVGSVATAAGPSAAPATGVSRRLPMLSSVESFERATDAARQISSGGGDSITRAELRGAIGFFQHDDGVIDRAERTCLANLLADPGVQEALAGAARQYAVEFLELNADLPQASMGVSDVRASLIDLFGAAGALTSSIWMQEAKVQGAGVIAQASLRSSYSHAYNASASTFDPINLRELINELSGRVELGTPSQDEVDGVVAYLTQGAKAGSRIYLASWLGSSRTAEPGDIGGVVIAVVANDRRSVRFLEVHGWTE